MTFGSSAQFILTLACPSASGQVAALSAFLDGLGCYIDKYAVERRRFLNGKKTVVFR